MRKLKEEETEGQMVAKLKNDGMKMNKGRGKRLEKGS